MAVTNSHKQRLKPRIQEVAMRRFFERGIRAVKMDDIANELSISKRTLYEIYADKEQLLLEGIQNLHNERHREMVAFSKKDGVTVMDIIISFYHHQIKMAKIIHPLFYADIGKYSRVVKYFEDIRDERRVSTESFFRRGVAEGFFRPDVDYRVILDIDYIFDKLIAESVIRQKYSPSEIFKNIVVVYIRGFCTPKGVKILDSQHI